MRCQIGKTVFIITILAVILAGATVAFAADAIKISTKIVSGLEGELIEDVAEARANGETYGEQAAGANMQYIPD